MLLTLPILRWSLPGIDTLGIKPFSDRYFQKAKVDFVPPWPELLHSGGTWVDGALRLNFE